MKAQNKLYYKIKNKRTNLIKIQKWYKNISFLKKLKNLVNVVKIYRKYINKIIFIQYFYRNYSKKNRKYPCPYSLDEYYEIPKEYRIVHRYCKKKIIDGKYSYNIYHNRYYNILWLHKDFVTQCTYKRFVVEPIIKTIFCKNFVIETALQSWKLIRNNNIFLDKNESLLSTYNIYNDWGTEMKRRSLYGFTLMVLDLFNLLEISYNSIYINQKYKYIFGLLKSEKYISKYHHFFVNILYYLKNITSQIGINEGYDISKRYKHYVFSDKSIFHERSLLPDIYTGKVIYDLITILFKIKQSLSKEWYTNIIQPIKKSFLQYIIYDEKMYYIAIFVNSNAEYSIKFLNTPYIENNNKYKKKVQYENKWNNLPELNIVVYNKEKVEKELQNFEVNNICVKYFNVKQRNIINKKINTINVDIFRRFRTRYYRKFTHCMLDKINVFLN